MLLEPVAALLRNIIKKPMTYMFPPETPLTEGFRGRHILNLEKCIGCGNCARICPNEAIEIKDKKPHIDYSKCCFCGLCVDVCPTKALQFTNFVMMVEHSPTDFLYSPSKLAEEPEMEHPKPTKKESYGMFGLSRSLWILNYMTGCCFIEAIPWVSSGFDMERFGLIAVGSPRHADVLIVGGYVTRKTLKNILLVYKQMPEPKYVVSLGNCPMSGGTYWDSYNTIDNIEDYLPVDLYVAGCPPRPEPIGLAVVKAMEAIKAGYKGKRGKVSELGPNPTKMPPKEGTSLWFGPCHPASGNFNLSIKLDGEKVIEVKPNVGYLHRGFEKLMEYRTWWQNVMLVPRICVLDGAHYELAYIGALESLANITIPERARILRVIQAELSRIQSHLLNLGLIANAAGLDAVVRISWGLREKILLLLEKLTGARIYQIYNIPGGVRRDVDDNFIKDLHDTILYFKKIWEQLESLTVGNDVFVSRTEKIGILKNPREFDVTGPNGRASGWKFDVRENSPLYDGIDFDIVTSTKGDAYARTVCRMNEIMESLHILDSISLPPGDIRVKKTDDGKAIHPYMKIPEGEGFYCVESARGELCFHLVSKGDNKPYRAKVRGPTFDTILVAMPQIMRNIEYADIPAIYWSLDNCPADHDR